VLARADGPGASWPCSHPSSLTRGPRASWLESCWSSLTRPGYC
jgi:hypothetical protein